VLGRKRAVRVVRRIHDAVVPLHLRVDTSHDALEPPFSA
jgi:hypothetical protein